MTIDEFNTKYEIRRYISTTQNAKLISNGTAKYDTPVARASFDEYVEILSHEIIDRVTGEYVKFYNVTFEYEFLDALIKDFNLDMSRPQITK